VIEQQAKVIAVEGNNVVVESMVNSTCSGCQQIDSCGSGQISKAFPQKKLSYEIVTELSVKEGDRVVIGLSEKLLLSAAWQVYLWPLIGLILASLFGQWLIELEILMHELLAVAVGVLGGYTGFFFAKKKQSQMAKCQQWAPQLVKVIQDPISVTQITP